MSGIRVLGILILSVLLYGCEPVKEKSSVQVGQTDTVEYSATDDFVWENQGNTSFYLDKNKRGNLAIDPVRHRDQLASAFVVYNGTGGLQRIALRSYYEFDGESHYTLAINGNAVATFTNPGIPDKGHEGNFINSLGTFRVTPGDTLWMHAQSHSNKKYPEEGAPGGYAWSRGRWSALLLMDSEGE